MRELSRAKESMIDIFLRWPFMAFKTQELEMPWALRATVIFVLDSLCCCHAQSLFYARRFWKFQTNNQLGFEKVFAYFIFFNGGFTSTSLNNFSWHWSKKVDFELQWLLSVLKSIKNGFLVHRWSRDRRIRMEISTPKQKPTSINQ